MKHVKRTMATMAAFAFMLSAAMPAQAAETASVYGTTTTQLSAAGDSQCDVSITRTSSFKVQIPKTITMAGSAEATNTATYTVIVSGDMAGYSTVTVTPDASFQFNQTDKASVNASVTQEKTSFSIGDGKVTEENIVTGYETEGTVSATGLSAGTWTGSFNFAIGYSEASE